MSFGARVRRLDGAGMLLWATSAAAVALSLSWANSLYPWSSWRTIVPFVIGLVMLVMFRFYERKPMEPVIPYRIFGNITAVSSFITGLIHGAILYTMLLYLPLFFQAVFLKTTLEAAISMLPICCVVVAFSLIAPVIIEITRKYCLLLWLGWVTTVLFLGLWCLVGPTTSRAEANSFQALLGIGVGILFTGIQIPLQASVSHVDDTGLVVGMLVVFRYSGGLLGLAVGSTVFNSLFQRSIAAVKSLPESEQILEDASQAISFIPMLRTLDLSDQSMSTLIEVYRDAFQGIWVAMTCIAGIGSLVSLFTKHYDLENEEIGRQGFDRAS